jgi:branched-chain amino acid transport system ATP-binding protein
MLVLEDIHAGYDGHEVLRGVTLMVPDRSVVALLGPNGAGKTTLLRAASGLLQATGGSMMLDGTDVTGWTTARLAEAGVCHVPEGRGVFPGLSVRDNIRLQAPAGAWPAALDQAVTAFPPLRTRVDQLAGTLSGGEQQMLALAHAYLSDPMVVLLDEVSMGLAPIVVDEIFEHLRALAAQGTALLVVEQYVTRALELADYAYVLQRGRVEFAGEPGELDEGALAASYLGQA